MSFLSSIASIGKTAFSFFTGDSIASTLARTATLGFALNKISNSAIKQSDGAQARQNIDGGIKLQVDPDPQYVIPTLYGRAQFGGAIFDAEMADDNQTMWFAIALAENTGLPEFWYSTNTGYTWKEIYRNNKRLIFKSDGVTVDYAIDANGQQDRTVDGQIEVYLFNDRDDPVAPEGSSLSNPQDSRFVFPRWTSASEPEGLLMAIVKIKYNRDKGITALGDFQFDINNDLKTPGEVIDNYMRGGATSAGFTGYGLGLAREDIDIDSLQALTAYANQSVSYTDEQSTSQVLDHRYEINGLVDNRENVLQNLEKMANACASWIGYDVHQGQWAVKINKADTAVAEFTDENILSSIQIGGTGLTDLHNSVKVEFSNKEVRGTADFVRIDLPVTSLNPNEPFNSLDLAYDLVDEQVQAELLGFIELQQSRVDLVINFQADYSYLNLKAGEVIEISNSRFGFDKKLFRIITVVESHSTDGALFTDITALEYQDSVYEIPDITRFTRITDDGIITIRALSAPSQPQVTKFETDTRPRIEIETDTPSGIVTGIEFWITTDTDQSQDSDRNYTLLNTVLPQNGNTFSSGTTVTTQADNLSSTDFFVKARAFNSEVTGPFSAPSGFVQYRPVQTTDALTPNTDVLDSAGNLALALTAVSLLRNLDDFFGGDTASGGLFDTVFDLFKDVTGLDILGDPDSVSNDQAQVTIQQDGQTVMSPVTNINFQGSSGVIAPADANDQNNGNVNFTMFMWGPNGEQWQTVNSTTEQIDIDGILIERIRVITFERPDGYQVTMNVDFPDDL